jgi:hypothetical protein
VDMRVRGFASNVDYSVTVLLLLMIKKLYVRSFKKDTKYARHFSPNLYVQRNEIVHSPFNAKPMQQGVTVTIRLGRRGYRNGKETLDFCNFTSYIK